MKHVNNGQCEYCLSIINRYPGFNENLKSWFVEFQGKHPEVHTSCAGRGEQDQEMLFAKGATRAHFGQSAHNFGLALDLFVIIKGSNSIYPQEWFNNILAPNLPKWIEWFGAKGSVFFELPHIEIRGWKELVRQGIVKLIK